VTRPKIVKAVDGFEIGLSKTFLGMDKNTAHTFKLPKNMDEVLVEFFSLNDNSLQVPIRLYIEGRMYDAQLRWWRGNRTMPHIHPPEALPKRDGTFFVWAGRGYIQTQMKMRDVFRGELRDYEATGSISPCKIRFHHLGENVFLMLRSDGLN
jgi:hypothetical protein